MHIIKLQTFLEHSPVFLGNKTLPWKPVLTACYLLLRTHTSRNISKSFLNFLRPTNIFIGKHFLSTMCVSRVEVDVSRAGWDDLWGVILINGREEISHFLPHKSNIDRRKTKKITSVRKISARNPLNQPLSHLKCKFLRNEIGRYFEEMFLQVCAGGGWQTDTAPYFWIF